MQMHIEFRPDGTAKIEVDGHDISKHVRRHDFSIVPHPDPDSQRWLVNLTLMPTRLLVDGELVDPPQELTAFLGSHLDQQNGTQP